MVWNGEKLESEQYHDVGKGKNGDRSKVRDEQGEESGRGVSFGTLCMHNTDFVHDVY